MKKFFILSSVFLMGMSLSLAQTTVTPSDTPVPAKVTKSSALENIEIRVDRRLINFNRYIAARDMVGIKSIVSGENKDFYANFLKYIEEAPIFTVKRDTTQDIIKMPLDEYTFPTVMSLGGKSVKVSMSFIEEDSETGAKWVIVDSDLHIVWKSLSPTLPAKGGQASGALNTDTPTTEFTVPKPKNSQSTPVPPPAKTTVVPAKAGTTPLSSAAIPSKPTTTKAAPAIINTPPVLSAPKAGLWTGGIIGIALWITVLLWALVWGYYYFIRKGRGHRNALLASQAASVASVATIVTDSSVAQSMSTPVVPPTEVSPVPEYAPLPSETVPESSAPEQTESNVSLVEDTASSPSETLSSTNDTPPPLETPPLPQNDSQEQSPSPDTTSTPTVDTSDSVEEKVSDVPPENISVLSDAPWEGTIATEDPVGSLSDSVEPPADTPSTSSEVSPERGLVMDPLFSSASAPVEAAPEWALVMDPIFSPPDQTTSLSPDPLFENILSPKPDPSTISPLFGTMV